MNKTKLTKVQIAMLVAMGNRIMPASSFSKLRSIGRKYDRELIHDKLTNLQLIWDCWVAMLNALPQKNGFRAHLEERRQWQNRNIDRSIIFEFVRQIGCWDEYQFLCDPAWNELSFFSTSTLGSYGVPTEGAVRPLIAAGGDYEKYLSQWDFSTVEREDMKASEKVRNNIEGLLGGLDPIQRKGVANLVQQYAETPEGMNKEEFYNLFFFNAQ